MFIKRVSSWWLKEYQINVIVIIYYKKNWYKYKIKQIITGKSKNILMLVLTNLI